MSDDDPSPTDHRQDLWVGVGRTPSGIFTSKTRDVCHRSRRPRGRKCVRGQWDYPTLRKSHCRRVHQWTVPGRPVLVAYPCHLPIRDYERLHPYPSSRRPSCSPSVPPSAKESGGGRGPQSRGERGHFGWGRTYPRGRPVDLPTDLHRRYGLRGRSRHFTATHNSPHSPAPAPDDPGTALRRPLSRVVVPRQGPGETVPHPVTLLGVQGRCGGCVLHKGDVPLETPDSGR